MIDRIRRINRQIEKGLFNSGKLYAFAEEIGIVKPLFMLGCHVRRLVHRRDDCQVEPLLQRLQLYWPHDPIKPRTPRCTHFPLNSELVLLSVKVDRVPRMCNLTSFNPMV